MRDALLYRIRRDEPIRSLHDSRVVERSYKIRLGAASLRSVSCRVSDGVIRKSAPTDTHARIPIREREKENVNAVRLSEQPSRFTCEKNPSFTTSSAQLKRLRVTTLYIATSALFQRPKCAAAVPSYRLARIMRGDTESVPESLQTPTSEKVKPGT